MWNICLSFFKTPSRAKANNALELVITPYIPFDLIITAADLSDPRLLGRICASMNPSRARRDGNLCPLQFW
jgi:hypothetical protein